MKLLVAGIFGWLVSHVLINVGAMLGLVPLTGITLPFLSLGGTSLIFITAAFGIAFNISRYSSLSYAKEEGNHANMASRRGNRWSRSAAYGARLRA
jgi:cell division protein FtsW